MSVLESMRDFVATARLGLAEVINQITPSRKRRLSDSHASEPSGSHMETNGPVDFDIPFDAWSTDPSPAKRQRRSPPASILRGPQSYAPLHDGRISALPPDIPTSHRPSILTSSGSGEITSARIADTIGSQRYAQPNGVVNDRSGVDTPDSGRHHFADNSFTPLHRSTGRIRQNRSLEFAAPTGLAEALPGSSEVAAIPRHSLHPSSWRFPLSENRSGSLRSISRRRLPPATTSPLLQSPSRSLIDSAAGTRGAIKQALYPRSPYARNLYPTKGNVVAEVRRATEGTKTTAGFVTKMNRVSRPHTSALDESIWRQSVGRYHEGREARRLSFGGSAREDARGGVQDTFATENTQSVERLREETIGTPRKKATTVASEHSAGRLQFRNGFSKRRLSSTGGGGGRDERGTDDNRKAEWRTSDAELSRVRTSLEAARLEEQHKMQSESLYLHEKVSNLEKQAAPVQRSGMASGIIHLDQPDERLDEPLPHGIAARIAPGGMNYMTTARGASSGGSSLRPSRHQNSVAALLRRQFPSGVVELFENPLFRAKMLKANVQIEAMATFEDRCKERLERLQEQERRLLEIRAASSLHQRRLDHKIDVEKHVFKLQKSSLEKRTTLESLNVHGNGINGGDTMVPDEPAADMQFDFDYEHDVDPDWDEEGDSDAVAEAERGVTVVDETSAYAPLTVSALRRVRRRMSERGQRELVNINKIPIHVSDLQLLRPNVWLNDEVINGYMELIKDRSERSYEVFQSHKGSADQGLESPWSQNRRLPRVQIMTSFFYPKLFAMDRSKGCCTYDYSRVRRWTRKFNILDYDMMIVPINQSNVHWTLGVVNVRDKRIEYYDSMGASNKAVEQNLLRWVGDEMEDKKQQVIDLSEWTTVSHGRNVPQQTNSDDCGMFMCKFADFVARDAPYNFSARHMNYFRARMAHELLMKRLA